MRLWILLLMGVMLLLAPLVPAPAVARACQVTCTPINLVLRYLPQLSNWGPRGATGVVELVLSEAEARGRVTGLPRLEGDRYQAMLVNTSTDEALPFGSFNTDDAQRAQFRFILDEDIPDRGWNLFIITILPADQPVTGPPERRSIGAFFPGIEQRGAMPAELPDTGGASQALESAMPPIVPGPTMSAPAAVSLAVPPLDGERPPSGASRVRPIPPASSDTPWFLVLMAAGLAGLAGFLGGRWRRRA